VHLFLFPLVYALAYLLRFDFAVPPFYVGAFARTVVYLTVLRFGAFWASGLFKGWWRHTSLYDLMALARATTTSSLLFGLLVYLTVGHDVVPRSVFLMDWVLTLVIAGGIRVGVRLVRESMQSGALAGGGKRTLVIGAGDDAARLLRELHRDPASGVYPVGILDDDSATWGQHIHGVRVLGSVADVKAQLAQQRIAMIVIAMPTISRDDVRRLVEVCSGSGVEIKVMPSLGELVDGRSHLSQLRTVAIEDLLGRKPVQLDLSAVASFVRGRSVLVTGGAGSIGSELARQVAGYGPRRLVLLDKAESPLFFTDLDLRRTHPELEIVPVVGDVTNRATVGDVFARHAPEIVLHAAAYKHVPLMEANVAEAVRNNVIGTLTVAELACEHGAESFLLISTDKAVHPSSVMGATKRVAELLLLRIADQGRCRTQFRAVRFGNVLGSDGSVVPVFKRQIAEGGPVTVTHPDVTRYFMTIPEAVQLVLQTATLPESAGHVAMLDMGEPVRIVDLAKNLIRLSGFEPYTEIPIVFTGLRPGEKLSEDLRYEVDRAVPTAVEKIRIVETAGVEDVETVDQALDRLYDGLASGNVGVIFEALRALVPECVSPLRERCAEVPDRDLAAPVAAGTR
jgi:FlaA1/EpsC-like NDP-sugar epimerase